MGGEPAGPVDRAEHDKQEWEKRVDALKVVLGAPGRDLVSTDEMRRAIEDLGPEAYDRMCYYERWIHAVTEILLEKRVVGVSELGERMAEVERRAKAQQR
jgi:hypothetical protein